MLKRVFPQGHVTSPSQSKRTKKSRNYLILAGNFEIGFFGGKIFVEIANPGTLVFGTGGAYPKLRNCYPVTGTERCMKLTHNDKHFFRKNQQQNGSFNNDTSSITMLIQLTK